MKKIVKIFVVFFSLILLSGAESYDKNRNPLSKADELFDQGRFQEALTLYEGMQDNFKDKDTDFKVFYRICESLAGLYRYGEAAQKIENITYKFNGINQARFLILKTEVLYAFLKQYSTILRKDVIDEESKETFKLTPDEIQSRISNAYKELWQTRKNLTDVKLKNEGYFIDIKDADLDMYPTLFDYAVLKYTDYLIKEEASITKEGRVYTDAFQLLKEEFDRPVNFEDAPELLTAEIIEYASNYKISDRESAAERLKIKRLLLPIRSNVFKLDNYNKYCRESVEILLKWKDNFKIKDSKANAAYEAASIYNRLGQYAESVKLCREIENKFSGTYYSKLASKLKAQIELPSLTLNLNNYNDKKTFRITTKNINKVYLRLYRFKPEEIRELTENKFNGWASLLRRPDQITLKKIFKFIYIFKKWTIDTGDKGDYRNITNTASLPELENGLYLVAASNDGEFKIGTSIVKAGYLNVSDLTLVGSPGLTNKTEESFYKYIYNNGHETIQDKICGLYTFNSRTGVPEKDVKINIYYRSKNINPIDLNLQSDENGLGELLEAVTLRLNTYSYHYIDPLAEKNGSYAYWNSQQYINYQPPNLLKIFIETDRPVYRPNQMVNIKVIVLRETSDGFRTLEENNKVKIRINDPNWKEISNEEKALNKFGSADYTFKIPTGKLLGRYNISAEAEFKNKNYTNRINFKVEEYKRPEFEVKLKSAKEVWKYGKKVNIEGDVKYYFGGAVPDAPVKYKIKRVRYIPYYYRWWFNNYSMQAEEIVNGETKTDEEGNYSIEFTPTPPPESGKWRNIPEISQFIVEIESRDKGGRTIEASQTFRAGKKSFYYVIEPEKGFFLSDEPNDIKVSCFNINDEPFSANGEYKIYTLSNAIPTNLPRRNNGGYRYWVPPLDLQLKNLPNDKLIAEGSANIDTSGIGKISLNNLPTGVYRIIVKSTDEWGEEINQEKIFVSADRNLKAVPVKARYLTIPQQEDYKVGDIAKFIIGSYDGSGIYWVEIWKGQYLISKQLLNTELPVQTVDIKVTEKMKGGFTLRWFGVKDYRVDFGDKTVYVPWTEKKLNISFLKINKILKPGDKVKWSFKITDNEGKPAAAEALALMYDRSLEYYSTSNNRWIDSIYKFSSIPNYCIDSLVNPYVMDYRITEGIIDKMMRLYRMYIEAPQEPGLRLWRTMNRWNYNYSGMGYRTKAMSSKSIMFDAAVEADDFSAPTQITDNKLVAAAGEEEKKERTTETSDIKARQNFVETAFFKPHIFTDDNGIGEFSFNVPEQLTSWKIKVFGITQDVKEGRLTEETVTKKNLMVRIDIPRFFREKDRGTITAIVHNETDTEIVGDVYLYVSESDKPVNDKIGISGNEKIFTIPPHSLKAFDWEVNIPEGIRDYKLKAVAISGEEKDAEERTIPVLPSRERLIESKFVMLSGNTSETLNIKLKNDPTRISEFQTLQVEPQLFLNVLNTLPFLVEYPYECVEQTLNKFVPLSIVNSIYKEYPAIRNSVSKIPKRNTITPAWEKDDPLRLVKLTETPWVYQSEGRPTYFHTIDMFDPGLVRSKQEDSLNKLKEAQLSDGSFPWWAGGRSDLYMTLYVLSGFAEARRYGVYVPEDMINRALNYINKEIPFYMKPDERNICITAFAAYVMTAYPPSEFSAAKEGKKLVEIWLKFLDKNIYSMNPYAKSYLAYTYYRIGNKQRADEILDMIMDGAREDELTGVYWTPEKYSWVWYRDTVEQHSFILKTLVELRPEDKHISGMVKWLLFNKKANVWKSTRASAGAIYSLFDYMKKTGSLTETEKFKVVWGKEYQTFAVKPDEFLDKPIRFSKTGFDITPDLLKAKITKEGPGIAFASMTYIYSTDEISEPSEPGILSLDRKFYKRVKQGDNYHLKTINSGDSVKVGDEIEVRIKINTRSQFEYMHLKDPKASGFETEKLLSGWHYDQLSFYEEQRDSLTNFFINWLPQGEYVLTYRMKPSKAGVYRIGSATLQSMYSPDMTAHSGGFVIRVES